MLEKKKYERELERWNKTRNDAAADIARDEEDDNEMTKKRKWGGGGGGRHAAPHPADPAPMMKLPPPSCEIASSYPAAASWHALAPAPAPAPPPAPAQHDDQTTKIMRREAGGNSKDPPPSSKNPPRSLAEEEINNSAPRKCDVRNNDDDDDTVDDESRMSAELYDPIPLVVAPVYYDSAPPRPPHLLPPSFEAQQQRQRMIPHSAVSSSGPLAGEEELDGESVRFLASIFCARSA